MKRLMVMAALLAGSAGVVMAQGAGDAATLTVGLGKTFALPSQAAGAARDGDTVEIQAGAYSGDVAIWRANHLTIRGVGGRPVLEAKGNAAERKAIWVIKGNDTTVENIEFTGATVADKNGAGIRQEGDNLTVRKCFFHDNEDGILGGGSSGSDVLIEDCEFDHNGQGDGYSHNLYIGHVRSFTLRGCWTHNANAGHDVKSRAATNCILYNRISDEDLSNTSYLIDLPNGGVSYVIGNILRRGPNAGQGILVSYAEEGPTNAKQALYIINNTLADDNTRHAATFIRVAGQPPLRVVNNLILGKGALISGALGEQSHNVTVTAADVANAAKMNYLPLPGSGAVDAGIDPGSAGGYDLTPRLVYLHPAGLMPRPVERALDAGAYELADKPHE